MVARYTITLLHEITFKKMKIIIPLIDMLRNKNSYSYINKYKEN